MPSVNYNRRALIAALVGAAVCLFFQRISFFSLFFLVPLGVVSFSYDYRVAWFSFFMAAVGNVFLSASSVITAGTPIQGALWDILFFIVIASMFGWVTAPPPGFSRKVSGAVRLIAGSCIVALLFTAIFFRTIATQPFSDYINSWIDTLLSMYRSANSDAVQNAVLESLTTDVIIKTMKSVMLRGGSLVSIILLFFVCRQISLAFSSLSRRLRGLSFPRTGTLAAFHVYPVVIWIFSGSLFLVVLSRIIKLEIPEIILWNILILCVIMYLAQGFGILQFFLTKPSMHPSLRFLSFIVLFVLIFSPVLNVVFFAGIFLLGIAENWASFRASKNNGPPSTPGAGDIRN